MLLPLHCIQPEGGALGCTLLVVQRKHPSMVWERLPSGITITRSPQAHTAAQTRFEEQAAKVRIPAPASCHAHSV